MKRSEQGHSLVERLHDLASSSWVMFLLLLGGLVALITAVLVAWPAIAYLASRYFGLG